MNLKNMTETELSSLLEKVNNEIAQRAEWPKNITLYFHRGKEENYEVAEALGLEDEAAAEFMYTGYELVIDAEVHRDGTAYAIKFGNAILEPKVIL